jgi:hypothetical protein
MGVLLYALLCGFLPFDDQVILINVKYYSIPQCCGTVTIFYGSGSGSSSISKP